MLRSSFQGEDRQDKVRFYDCDKKIRKKKIMRKQEPKVHLGRTSVGRTDCRFPPFTVKKLHKGKSNKFSQQRSIAVACNKEQEAKKDHGRIIDGR